MNILLDFDGTVIDYAARMHRLFLKLVPECKMDRQEYWTLKRAPNTHRELLTKYYGYSEAQIEAFEDAWMPAIESDECLALDTLFPFCIDALPRLADHGPLTLLTSRQSEAGVLRQLERLGIAASFAHVIVTGLGVAKVEAVARYGLEMQSGDMLVGDTEADIETARRLSITAITVSSGCRDAGFLAKHEPDFLYSDISDFVRKHF